MNTIYRLLITSCVIITLMVGCGNSSKESTTQAVAQERSTESPASADTVSVPQFDEQRAYDNVAKQVSFGYRVPGTKAHTATAQWLIAEMERYGAEVVTQKITLTAYDGTRLPICNIIAQFAPEKSSRILLAAHWDSRPYADYDTDKSYHNKPIDGANDGASGVGVLLEIARLLGEHSPEVGVDIILFDAEDYGAPQWVAGDNSDTWALGSQYWATHLHKPGYLATYGILLDMVGAKGAVFYREAISEYFAPNVIDMVWSHAARLGYDDVFVNLPGGAVTDDHLYMNAAGIPSIDIIHFDPNSETGFFPQWHTREDNMQHIDKTTLKAVGQTLLSVIYHQKQ